VCQETKKFVLQYGNAGKSKEFARDAEKLYIKVCTASIVGFVC
jgi:hypothetical protein